MINWLRDFFGMPKEKYEYDRQDLTIILGAFLTFTVFSVLGVKQTIDYRHIMYYEEAKNEELIVLIFAAFAIYSLISLIVIIVEGLKA